MEQNQGCSTHRIATLQQVFWRLFNAGTGFTADGVFVSEHVLHHGGMVLRRVVPGADTAAPREVR